MRLTIIRADNFVSIDGRGLTVDCSALPEGVAAVQWKDGAGEVEFDADAHGDLPPNERITSIEAYQAVIVAHASAADAIDNPGPPPAPTKPQLKAVAAAQRYRLEVAGVAWDGHIIATDRESQTKLLAEFVAIGAAMRADPSPWKFAGGEFDQLNNAQMAAVIVAARSHIADAFDREQNVITQIEAGTISTVAQVVAAFEA